MSTLEETPAVSEPIKENNPSTMSEPTEKNMETTVKSKKPTLKGYRQKLQAIQARTKYREKGHQRIQKPSQEGHIS